MASNTRILVDVSNLSWRNWYAINGRGPENFRPVVHGLLRDVTTLARTFQTANFVFCFDSVNGYERSKALPEYKTGKVKVDGRLQVHEELNSLYSEVLRGFGFNNVLREDGAEADDLIGEWCRRKKTRDEDYVIASNDSDLYQLLRGEEIVMWNPLKKQTFCEGDLMDRFTVTPEQWVTVKALTGCDTDGIPGIPGIGIQTAIQHAKGVLKEGPRRQKIRDYMDRFVLNFGLVQVPYEKLSFSFTPFPDYLDLARWNEAATRFNIPHAVGRYPG